MQTYYLYLLDDGGRVARRVDLDSGTPDAALKQAQAYPHEHGKELWRLTERLWGSLDEAAA
jgi:hypothetical protein